MLLLLFIILKTDDTSEIDTNETGYRIYPTGETDNTYYIISSVVVVIRKFEITVFGLHNVVIKSIDCHSVI